MQSSLFPGKKLSSYPGTLRVSRVRSLNNDTASDPRSPVGAAIAEAVAFVHTRVEEGEEERGVHREGVCKEGAAGGGEVNGVSTATTPSSGGMGDRSARGSRANSSNSVKAQQEGHKNAAPRDDNSPTTATTGFVEESRSTIRLNKFTKVLEKSTVDLDALRELAWSGIPAELRPCCWRLLLGYQPVHGERAESVLGRRRGEYRDALPRWYDIADAQRSDDELGTLRQIYVDVPRTAPAVPFFQSAPVQRSLQRILYIWAIRHPASGYVQGINDLCVPFLYVFLSAVCEGDISNWDASAIPEETLVDVEADCFWCLSKLLDGIQDHYTFAQPGIQRMVFRLKELVRRIDEGIYLHLERQNVEFLQFAFRWFNCLLSREVPFMLVQRLWDTYLAEGDKFADFLVYLCAALLLRWADQLRLLDFQDMVIFLQHLPTQEFTVQARCGDAFIASIHMENDVSV
eukprot:jgi/Chlat1/8229/Chrsp77S00619